MQATGWKFLPSQILAEDWQILDDVLTLRSLYELVMTEYRANQDDSN